MISSKLLSVLTLVIVLVGVSAVRGQNPSDRDQYEPVLDQAGKDVVWHPTEDLLMEAMLDLAKVTPKDYLIDLGSGDGRIVIAAAKRGARAMGVEFNADLVSLSKRRAIEAGVGDRTRFIEADLFETNLLPATVITMFLRPDLNVRLRPKILALRPGTRVVSNSFDMEKWKADETVSLDDCELYCTAYFWTVPARVAGAWETLDGTLNLKQEFQMVTGTYTEGNRENQVWDGLLRGRELTFRIDGMQYRGLVTGGSIRGTVDGSGQQSTWIARRKTP